MVQNAQQADFSPFDAHDWRIGIVVAQFNRHITDRQYQSALEMAEKYHIPSENITTIKVAGAIEIPLALQKLAASSQYTALLALGCIIQGETPHFDYVAKFVTEGILRVQLDHSISIGFGILTCNNEQQAIGRTQLAGDHLEAALQQAKALK
jgi:6,7-dimethyl-8-ribityllumazine synthase